MPHKYDQIDTALKREMALVVCDFSPENLTCDGELTSSQIKAKVARLSRKWNKLVEKSGIDVDFNEFELYILSTN